MSGFVAPGWARNAHLQTVWAPLFRRHTPPPRRRERFPLPDGDFLALDWTDEDPVRPLVVVLHGLAGSGDSTYVVGIQNALCASEISSVVMHFRGAGGEPNRLARGYHSGETGDLDTLIGGIVARFPQRPLALLGYSLGGNVALKWLGELGGRAPVVAACAVSVPFELAPCSARLDRGFSRLYRDRLLRELVTGIAIKERALRAAGATAEADRLAALGDLSRIRSFREYDDRVVAPLHGFRDADDYYAHSGARRFLADIRRPTLVLHARDDPFMTPAVVPARTEVATCVQLEVSAHGGHVGFVQGSPWRPRYWLEARIPSWLQARFAQAAAGDSRGLSPRAPPAAALHPAPP